MSNTVIIHEKPVTKQPTICPVCGLDWAVAKEYGYTGLLNHCARICKTRRAPEAAGILPNVLPAALGRYSALGFALVEMDDHLLELRHGGDVIGHFTQHATITALQTSCEEHLAVCNAE